MKRFLSEKTESPVKRLAGTSPKRGSYRLCTAKGTEVLGAR
ncbi:hypothetical protein HMPREF0262_03500 [Clostridium sp. ATCC 29733]|nr:hypothetical protein HMPREF0262_03500 [Clostridium sp. ATCC 29733]